MKKHLLRIKYYLLWILSEMLHLMAKVNLKVQKTFQITVTRMQLYAGLYEDFSLGLAKEQPMV